MTLAYGGQTLYNELEARSLVWANLSIYFQAGISPFIFLILCGFKRYWINARIKSSVFNKFSQINCSRYAFQTEIFRYQQLHQLLLNGVR